MGRGAGSPTAPRRVCRIRGATREAVSPLVLRGRGSQRTVPNISRGGEYLPPLQYFDDSDGREYSEVEITDPDVEFVRFDIGILIPI